MKLRMYTPSILILLFSLKCGSSHLKNYHSLIQGNWSTNSYISSVSKKEEKTIYFSFEDSVCALVYLHYSSFIIHKDTLIIYWKGPNNLDQDWGPIRYLIRHMDSATLALEHIEGRDWNPFNIGTIRLNRVKPLHDGTFDRIGFSYHKYQDGPQNETQYFEVDSSGIFYIDGLHHFALNGQYSGKVRNQDLEYVNQFIRSIPLEELNLYYTMHATHQDFWRVLLRTSLGTYETGGYGYSTEPIALLMLYNKLKQLYENANIKEDSSVIHHFQLSEFYRERNNYGYMRITEPRPMEITRFIRNGIDETHLFRQFTLFFQTGGELIVVGNGSKYLGTFDLVVNRENKKPVDLVYYFGLQNIEPLDRLDLEWRESPHPKGSSKFYHKYDGEEESVLELMVIRGNDLFKN